MSTKIKILKMITGLLLISTLASSQTTIEMPVFPFPADGNGITSLPRVITFQQDVNNAGTGFTAFTPGSPATPVTLTVSLGSQTYSGLTYSGCPTGLIFGAAPTDGTSAGASGTIPTATAISNYSTLGAFAGTGALGPQNNMFNSTAISAVGATGTGIDAINSTGFPNGGVSLFTAAQALYDGPGGLQPYNNTTKYNFGTIVLTFSQFVTDPIIHLAGIGGAYRYQFQSVGGGPSDPANWKSTFFTTELELISPDATLTYMSGNPFFSVSGKQINNTAASPNGGSAPQIPLIGIFDNYGAASGSVRINGTVRSLVFKVTLRGGVGQDFAWSALKSDLLNANRPPFTGDIWSIAASFAPAQLIPLPATGLRLTAALNGNDVQLNWKTLSESNSKNFEIERSTNGINFSSIATKNAAGESLTELNYNLVDANMSGTVYYYRIKMVDIDGKYTYSNIAIVRKTGAIKGIRTFPNPAVNQLNVEFSNAKGNYTVSLYNQAGQEVATQRTSINYTVQYVTINRNSLPGGSYILRVRNADNTESFVEKVVLQ
jgi:hypothetical protein